MNSELRSTGDPRPIYLDNNATTGIDRRVVEAMHAAGLERFANPASQHAEGRRARKALEEARSRIGATLGCRQSGMHADKIILTSGGTEANNLVVFGAASKKSGPVLVTSIEHPSVLGAAARLAESGSRTVRYIPVDAAGVVSLDSLRPWLDEYRRDGESPACLSVMLANNETGVLQPIDEIVKLGREYEIAIHSDAVQVVGKLPLSFSSLDLDAMTVTAHKLHGPVGIGALVAKHDFAFDPQLFGGFQQLGERPGTEAVVLAIGFATALEIACAEVSTRQIHMQTLRVRLERLLLDSPRPPVVIGEKAPRLPHTLSLAYPGINRQAFQMALDRSGIACSTGSACASGSSTPSHVLQAMKLSSEVVDGAVRLSLSHETTVEEIDEAARRIRDIVERSKR